MSDTEEAATLCRRGSAWACSELLTRRCESGIACSMEKLAEQKRYPEGAELVAKVEQLCQDGSLDACLALRGRLSPQEMIAFCRKGSKTACKWPYDPKHADLVKEPLCLQGDSDACATLRKKTEGNDAERSALFRRVCAADVSACLQGYDWFPVSQEEWEKKSQNKPSEPPIVQLREAPCSEVVLHARAIAGIPKPMTEPEAERFCQTKVSPAARSCILAATDVHAMSDCKEAQTSGVAIRQQAEQLAAAASAYFEEHGHIPPAPPPLPRPACCGARCLALAAGSKTFSAYPTLQPYWLTHRRRWVHLDLHSTDRELIASAGGDWDCDGTAEAYEARWSVINGKVSRITVTETASPSAVR